VGEERRIKKGGEKVGRKGRSRDGRDEEKEAWRLGGYEG